jgi:hypothetical protein
VMVPLLNVSETGPADREPPVPAEPDIVKVAGCDP